MARLLPSTPTETLHPPELLRVPEERVSENQPQANIIPTAPFPQKIRNMKSNPSNSRYALATRIITSIGILIHCEGNTVTNLITGSAEEYLALLSIPNSLYVPNNSQTTWTG